MTDSSSFFFFFFFNHTPTTEIYTLSLHDALPILTAFYLWEAALKLVASVAVVEYAANPDPDPDLDRKSTRLNSSHLGISYAVFCLKKKKKNNTKSNNTKKHQTTTIIITVSETKYS